MALRVRGHRLAWAGGPGLTDRWAEDLRPRHAPRAETLRLSRDRMASLATLHRTRRILLDDGRVFASVDASGRTV